MKKWVGFLFSGYFSILLSSQAFGGGDDFLKTAAGHYEGTLTTQFGEIYSQVKVKSDLSSDKNALKTITVTDEDGAQVLKLQLDKINNTNFVLSGPFVTPQLRLNRAKNDNCFSIQVPQPVYFCFYRDLITLDISTAERVPQISLALNKLATQAPIVLETPQKYDLSSAIDLAWKHNFDNRIEFEHVIQAKFGKKAAKKNLLSRISFSTIVNNIQPTLFTVLAAAGDLMPFLFPTRWLEAKRTSSMFEAEQDTMTLMRMDTVSQLEAAFYNYDNDRAIKDLYGDILEKAKVVRKQVDIREHELGTLPDGSTDNVDSIINFIDQSYIAMDGLLDEDKSAIAEIMGFYNPKAVADITLGVENFPITSAKALDSVTLSKIAIANSVELRQISFVIDAADDARKAVKWNWLDPTGDPNLGLGFAWKSNNEVASSQVAELKIVRDQIQQKYLGDKVFNAVTDYNTALKVYVKAAEGKVIQDRRLKQIDRLLDTSGTVDDLGLIIIGVLQDYLTAGVNAQMDIFAYRCARARIDRLLVQGYYTAGSKPPEIVRKP